MIIAISIIALILAGAICFQSIVNYILIERIKQIEEAKDGELANTTH